MCNLILVFNLIFNFKFHLCFSFCFFCFSLCMCVLVAPSSGQITTTHTHLNQINLVIYTIEGVGQRGRYRPTGRMLNICFAAEQSAMQAALPASLLASKKKQQQQQQ